MSLSEWAKNGWLRKHTPSKGEIKNLLGIVDRDLKDSLAKSLSDDWKFGIAYNAALKLCTVLLHGSGYRPERNLAHYRTIQALPLILGKKYDSDATYLDACRKKRNETEYDFAGGVSKDEAEELVEFCQKFKKIIIHWLNEKHKDLT